MNHKFHFFQICSQFFFHWFDTRPYKQIVFRLSAFNKDYNDIVCGLWSAREQMQHGNYLLSTKIKCLHINLEYNFFRGDKYLHWETTKQMSNGFRAS